jgi:hypothetical protein
VNPSTAAPGAATEPGTVPVQSGPVDPERASKEAEAKARRAARKAARASAPPPERDAAYDRFSLIDLRTVRTALTNEETRVSYWRRIVQARLDLLRSPQPDKDPVANLAAVLAEAPVVRRRIAHLTVHPHDDVPPLPDLAEVWSRQVDREDEVALARVIADLARAERELSTFRADLHHRIDQVTAELIARYRQQPVLALQILPIDPLHQHSQP